MRTHATRQRIGDRSHQCDATATVTNTLTRTYALLDGIGSSQDVQAWTRTTARRLARAAAHAGDAGTGLRAMHAAAAAEPGRNDFWADPPSAVAVVATLGPDGNLRVAWCGDARAYHLTPGGKLVRLTRDHNMREEILTLGGTPGPYARNTVTSYLGDTQENPKIGTAAVPGGGRLLLASDGAYEPLEDSCRDLARYLTGQPVARAASELVDDAIAHASAHADNATVLVAELT
jgi:serine/threonine protein phosphatase PrpC